MGSLVAAYTVAWVILMVYVVTLASRQRRLQSKLAALEADATASKAPVRGSAAEMHVR
ncbi:MAG: CcmD family protein [Terriglobales bacterium]